MKSSNSRRRRAASDVARLTPRERRTFDLRLGFLIHDVSRLRRRAFDEFMRPLGVTRAQWWIIAHISRQDGIIQTELASVLDVGKASLGTVIDRLEAGGLVERRNDPADRRTKRVFLTRKARQIIAKMQTAENRYNKIVLSGLDDADRSELVRLLSQIKDSLTALDTGRTK